MAETTGIAWTHSTFNPFRGCTKISPGCKFCYAERLSNRNPKVLGVWGPQGTRVLAASATWREPIKWDAAARQAGRPALVFCASLADVFEDWPGQMTDARGLSLWRFPESPPQNPGFNLPKDGVVPYTMGDARAYLWWLIRQTPNLRWQLLTKRPENIGRMMPPGEWPNVWLGTSVETQEYIWRLDALTETPQRVPVRFVSCEPLLGPLSLWHSLGSIQWVIIGGESGGESRPFHLAWAESLIAQCEDAGVACFVKQLGRVAMEDKRHRLPLYHDAGHGGDERDWPEHLRIRQFPPL